MKSHASENILPAHPRFHLAEGDRVFQPIPFLFVTERMQHEILNERQAILDALPSSLRECQAKIFERYDPRSSFAAFQRILGLFGISDDQ